MNSRRSIKNLVIQLVSYLYVLFEFYRNLTRRHFPENTLEFPPVGIGVVSA